MKIARAARRARVERDARGRFGSWASTARRPRFQWFDGSSKISRRANETSAGWCT
jgi:hypothetical protein